MWKCSFSEEPVDLKLLCLKMMKKTGIILVATVLGALVLGGIYYLKETVFSPNTAYLVVGETFIDYIPEEGYGISRVHITDEAWGSLAKSDDFVETIINEVAEKGYTISAELVRDSIDASVVSDSFVVTTTVYARDEQLAVSINAALQDAIVKFCSDRQEIAESFIMTCPEEAQRRSITREVLVAALIGAFLGLGTALVTFLISFLMDDSVYLPVSFEKRYGIPMLGTIMSEELAVNTKKLCEGLQKLAVVGLCAEAPTQEVTDILKDILGRDVLQTENVSDEKSKFLVENTEIFSAGTVEMSATWIADIADADGAILTVAAGRRDGKQIEKIIDFLKKQDVNVKAAVLCNADEALIARYYKPGILKKGKKISAKKQAGDEA